MDAKNATATTDNVENEYSGYASYLTPGITIKLESKTESYAYRLALVLPDNVIVCKSVNPAITEGFGVGTMLNLVRATDSGSCVIPVQTTAISDGAELIALTIMGQPKEIQRRMFARVKAGVGVQLKLQIDNHTSRYKSLEVYDISAGGVGVVIYSKNLIESGQFARLEIQLPVTGNNNRISARGQIVHCSAQNANRLAYLLGVKFTELSDADQRKLIEYIANLQDSSDSQQPPELSFGPQMDPFGEQDAAVS